MKTPVWTLNVKTPQTFGFFNTEGYIRVDVVVDELGRCWPRWLTICNLASYGHGIMVSSRQFPVISTRGSQWLWDVQRKKLRPFSGRKKTQPRLQDSISFGGIFWWKDDLSRWLTGMVECVTILSDHVQYKQNMYQHISHHFSINDSITMYDHWFLSDCQSGLSFFVFLTLSNSLNLSQWLFHGLH